MTEGKLNLFGIVNESKERAKVLDQYKQKVPMPTDCTTAIAALAKLRDLGTEINNRIANTGDGRPVEREKSAVATLTSQYTDFYNSQQCAAVGGDAVLNSSIVPQTSAAGQTPVTNNSPAAATTIFGTAIPNWAIYGVLGLLAVTAIVVILKPNK